jgi:hypothetical protein
MKKLSLIVEQSKDGKFWGRVAWDDNLLIEVAATQEALRAKMKKILKDFHQLAPSKVEFDVAYDLTALFTQVDYLNITAVAAKANISAGLMRQYVAGFKYPSYLRAKAIEAVINDLGEKMMQVKVAVVKSKDRQPVKSTKRKMTV